MAPMTPRKWSLEWEGPDLPEHLGTRVFPLGQPVLQWASPTPSPSTRLLSVSNRPSLSLPTGGPVHGATPAHRGESAERIRCSSFSGAGIFSRVLLLCTPSPCKRHKSPGRSAAAQTSTVPPEAAVSHGPAPGVARPAMAAVLQNSFSLIHFLEGLVNLP